MSHTINMLAKRNIQKYKKHYLIVLIVLLIVSTLIFSSFFISSLASNNTKKQSILNVKDCFISYFLLLCVYI